MSATSPHIEIPSVQAIKHLLEPIHQRLDLIDAKLSTSDKPPSKKYYRNNDIKELFGISSNTIIKYRETGILPYTHLGEVYLYEVKKIEEILKQNSI